MLFDREEEDIEPSRNLVTGTRTRNSSAFLIVLLSMLLSPTARAEEMVPSRPDASFTLRSGIAQGKMVYIGKGGTIDGQVNPTLEVHEGDIVQVTPGYGEGAEHDIVFPDVHASSQRVAGPGASSTLVFHAIDIGSFAEILHSPRPSRSWHGRPTQGRDGPAQSRAERREHFARSE